MAYSGFRCASLKHAIAFLTWLSVLLSTTLPAPGYADLCVSPDDELRTRTKVAYVVAGLTVIGLAVGIACLSNASGHHKHHSHSSGMSSVDNYRPYSYSSGSGSYSDYSYDSSESSHHHHSSHRSSYSYSGFSGSSTSGYSERSDSILIRGKTFCSAPLKGANKEKTCLSGHFFAHPSLSSDSSGSLTAFVQLPDGTTQTLGSLRLSENTSLPYGPYDQKGVYTFGVSLDSENYSSSPMKLGSIQVEKNGSTVQRQDFMAPPHASAGFEPAPCCIEL